MIQHVSSFYTEQTRAFLLLNLLSTLYAEGSFTVETILLIFKIAKFKTCLTVQEVLSTAKCS